MILTELSCAFPSAINPSTQLILASHESPSYTAAQSMLEKFW
jgi:hypothetical protein